MTMAGYWNAHSDLDWYAETLDVGQEPSQEDETMDEDDEGIQEAAVALAWAHRPPGFDLQHTPETCWLRQSELDQRLYLYRARVAIVAWELWKEKGR